MIFHAFLIKYAEIAIKGKNRYIFEDALVKQMNIALSKVEGEFEVKKEQGRIYVFCPEQYDYDETVEALQHVFGIVGICPVVIYEDQGFEQMAKDVVSYMKNCHPNCISRNVFPSIVRSDLSRPMRLLAPPARIIIEISFFRIISFPFCLYKSSIKVLIFFFILHIIKSQTEMSV